MATDHRGRSQTQRLARLAGGQWRAVLEPGRLLVASPRLLTSPRGDGSPVVVLPGLTTGDAVTAPLRRYLSARGWDTRGWGLGTNDGRRSLPEDVATLVRRVADEDGRRVGLVGWSLGGTIARAATERLNGEVDRVVTFGSPVRRDAMHRGPVSVTAIVSRDDGVVPFRDQLDDRPDVDVVEVPATHVGMTLSPDVWLVVAEALAAAP